MNILFAASEGVPFIKTGGLADVIGSLPKALKKYGLDVRVMLPKHGGIQESFKEKMTTRQVINVPLSWRNQYCGIQEMEYDGVHFYFIDNEYYFKREGLYGYNDDPERYAFFSKAVLESLPHLGFKPHILHCHDWHTGLVSVFLKAHYGGNPFYSDIKTVFTIHNLHYQGVFSKSILGDILGLGDEYFNIDGLEYYGSVNCLKGGLVFSDKLTTVSKTYADEIKYPYFGEGLDGILRKRQCDLTGILNGIDYDEYNPYTDRLIYAVYENGAENKKENKIRLQQELGLPQRDVPLMGMVTRLVDSKGLDLVNCVLNEILDMDVQMVVLGTGEKKYEDMFKYYAYRYCDKMSANIRFDNTLAHRIYAASDLFLMPSRFEPCGLGQIIALRYGSLPIVRETGGLKDTVVPYNEYTEEGNGFSFTNYNAHDMLYTIRRAVGFYYDKDKWNRIVKNAMDSNFSWERSAGEYEKLYRSMIK